MENIGIKLEKSENGYFAISNERYFKINEKTYDILEAKLAGEKTDEIANQSGVSVEEIEHIWNILLSKQEKSKKISKLFLIIPSVVNNFVGKMLSFLCNKLLFISLVVGFSLTFLHYLIYDDFKILYANLGIIDYLIVLFVVIMIHEYGHIVAAYYRNMKDLNIYAGFFIIFPTFFTKINDLVTKKFKQRLIVDFGGIYFQIISFIIVYLLCHIYKSDYLELFLSVNLIIISINIIPFYFTDGYWLYSDIFEIENLNVKSSAVLKGILTFNFTNENFKKSTILIYTVFKSILFVAIMIYVIRFLYYQSFYLGDTFYQIKESHGSIIVILRCFLLLLPYILFVLFIFNKLYYGYRKNFRGNH